MVKKDILLADCETEELDELVEGLNATLKTNIKVYTKIANGSHSKIYNLYRYMVYACFPIYFFMNRKKYRYIICWQQFYALFFCQLCRLFHTKDVNVVVACNYTYKPKKIFTRSYYEFFRKNSECKYMHFIHVPSQNYAKKCTDELRVAEEKFVVVPFGLPDTFEIWKNTEVEYKNYSFAIGRSNRDFDFLIEAWRFVSKDKLLIIASDSYKPSSVFPENVVHRTDIVGDMQFPYIVNCDAMIIPIQNGEICSGDTVLLKAMSYKKPVIVTSPSTLGEMYIDNGVNGLLVEKDPEKFGKIVTNLLSDPVQMQNLGIEARRKFENNYSRYHMGVNLGEAIKPEI